jgi:uncharacterized protein YggU (UPF0235/DUF167 family)
MGRPKKRDLPDLSDLAVPGASISVRAVPRASGNAVQRTGEGLKVLVTAAPENGKANDAVRALLASALGVAPSDLKLQRGAASRDKVFVLAGGAAGIG